MVLLPELGAVMFNLSATKNRKYQCDICGKENGLLEDLQDSFRTKHVKKVCDTCSGNLNTRLRQVVSIKNKFGDRLMKKFIEEQYRGKRHKQTNGKDE